MLGVRTRIRVRVPRPFWPGPQVTSSWPHPKPVGGLGSDFDWYSWFGESKGEMTRAKPDILFNYFRVPNPHPNPRDGPGSKVDLSQ